MDRKLHDRLATIELQLNRLGADVEKLMSMQLRRGKSCSEVSGVVKRLAVRQAEIGETVAEIFDKVFPKHGRYLADIDDALDRAKKKKPRGG